MANTQQQEDNNNNNNNNFPSLEDVDYCPKTMKMFNELARAEKNSLSWVLSDLIIRNGDAKNKPLVSANPKKRFWEMKKLVKRHREYSRREDQVQSSRRFQMRSKKVFLNVPDDQFALQDFEDAIDDERYVEGDCSVCLDACSQMCCSRCGSSYCVSCLRSMIDIAVSSFQSGDNWNGILCANPHCQHVFPLDTFHWLIAKKDVADTVAFLEESRLSNDDCQLADEEDSDFESVELEESATFASSPEHPVCGICYESPRCKTMSCCGHRYCESCLEAYIISTLPQNATVDSKASHVPCPTPDCSGYIMVHEMATFLSPQHYNNILKKLQKSEVALPKNIGRLSISAEDSEVLARSGMFDPMMSWVMANSRQCPKCFVRIEKNGGCDNMQCSRCRSSFQWPHARNFIEVPKATMEICKKEEVIEYYPAGNPRQKKRFVTESFDIALLPMYKEARLLYGRQQTKEARSKIVTPGNENHLLFH